MPAALEAAAAAKARASFVRGAANVVFPTRSVVPTARARPQPRGTAPRSPTATACRLDGSAQEFFCRVPSRRTRDTRARRRRRHDRRRHDADDAGRVAQLEVAAAADGAGQLNDVAFSGAGRGRCGCHDELVRVSAASTDPPAAGVTPVSSGGAGRRCVMRRSVTLRFRAAAQYPASA